MTLKELNGKVHTMLNGYTTRIVLGVVLTAMMALTGWTLKTVIQIREDVAVIQANRFTSSDGMLLYREIADIRRELERRPTRAEVPPEWFRDKVDELERRLDNIQ